MKTQNKRLYMMCTRGLGESLLSRQIENKYEGRVQVPMTHVTARNCNHIPITPVLYRQRQTEFGID